MSVAPGLAIAPSTCEPSWNEANVPTHDWQQSQLGHAASVHLKRVPTIVLLWYARSVRKCEQDGQLGDEQAVVAEDARVDLVLDVLRLGRNILADWHARVRLGQPELEAGSLVEVGGEVQVQVVYKGSQEVLQIQECQLLVA